MGTNRHFAPREKRPEEAAQRADQQPQEPAAAARGSALTPERVLALQRTVGNRAVAQLLSARRAETPAPVTASGGGHALPEATRARMERAFDADFSAVRVHVDGSAANLDAIAYTRGADIHFAPQRYAPHTSRGAALLGHELAHVVQQRQGRVAPTTELHGVATNTDAHLEAEADRAGRNAARGLPAGLGASSIHHAAPAAQRAVVQRAVGFEFETGWLVDRVDEKKRIPFHKKDRFSQAQYDGFHLEADEADGGRSEVEFVVEPPLPETKAGREKLVSVMDAMTTLGGELKSRHAAPFLLNAVTQQDGDAKVEITPRDAQLKAGPQVTMGLGLSSVPNLLEGKVSATPMWTDLYPNFKGFLMLVKQYLRVSTDRTANAIPYAKMIAQPLLARTDFAKLFSLCERPLQHWYQTHPDKWVGDVLKAIDLPGIANHDFLARGVESDSKEDKANEAAAYSRFREGRALSQINRDIAAVEAKMTGVEDKSALAGMVEQKAVLAQERATQLDLVDEMQRYRKHAGFTVSEWLLGLLNDTDRITDIADHESMSAFGDRTEEVGSSGAQAGIFEWRGDQATKIPLAQWKDYALRWFDRVSDLND